MNAQATLKHVQCVLDDRGAIYGDARVNISETAARWSETLGGKITPEQVCLCMIDLKMARLTATPKHLDSVIDIIGYAAILAELITD